MIYLHIHIRTDDVPDSYSTSIIQDWDGAREVFGQRSVQITTHRKNFDTIMFCL